MILTATNTAIGTFEFTNLPAATYRLEIWKDINNNNQLDDGDLVGHYGFDEDSGIWDTMQDIILNTEFNFNAMDIELYLN